MHTFTSNFDILVFFFIPNIIVGVNQYSIYTWLLSTIVSTIYFNNNIFNLFCIICCSILFYFFFVYLRICIWIFFGSLLRFSRGISKQLLLLINNVMTDSNTLCLLSSSLIYWYCLLHTKQLWVSLLIFYTMLRTMIIIKERLKNNKTDENYCGLCFFLFCLKIHLFIFRVVLSNDFWLKNKTNKI